MLSFNDVTKQIYKNGEFRRSEGDFSRSGSLPIEHLVISILQGRKGSYWSAVDRLADHAGTPQVTASAYCQARQKVPPELFSELSNEVLKYLDGNGLRKKWKGHRVLAVDGSGAQLPAHSTTEDWFGLNGNGKPEARISMLYDVLNHLVEEISMDHTGIGEHEFFIGHLCKVQEGDLINFDAGYASRVNMAAVESKGAFFVMRLTKAWNCVKDLLQSDDDERFEDIEIPEGHKRLMPWMPRKFRVRLVRDTASDGSAVVYATNLLDRRIYKKSAIRKLYGDRWQIEEGYKRIKARLRLADWTGKRVDCVMQDLQASAVVCNLAGLFCLLADKPKQPRKKKGKPRKKAILNRSQALSKARLALWDTIAGVIDKEYVMKILHRLSSRLEYTVPGQRKPRKNTIRRQYPMSYVMA